MAIMVIIVLIAIMHNHSLALLCIITREDLGHFWLGYTLKDAGTPVLFKSQKN